MSDRPLILPHADKAFIDIRKWTGYVLDPENARGRHKARVFKSAIGIDASKAYELSQAILAAVLSSLLQRRRRYLW